MDTHDLVRRFNRIGYIDQQSPLVTQAIPFFPQISKIFQRHKAIANFGIALVHRHVELSHGFAMVHQYRTPDEDLCVMEPLGSRTLFPRSYHLDGDTFLPYEFAHEPTITPSAEFLSEMKDFLSEHKLDGVIGLISVRANNELWLERPAETGNGTISRATPRKPGVLDGWRITEWTWREDGDGIEIVMYKGCEEKPAGHVRT